LGCALYLYMAECLELYMYYACDECL